MIGQVTRSQKEAQYPVLRSKFQLSLCTRPTNSFRPISFKLSGCVKLSELFNISFVFYIADLKSAGGHDLVMLSLWESIQIAPIPKILEISASFKHFFLFNA